MRIYINSSKNCLVGANRSIENLGSLFEEFTLKIMNNVT